MTIRNAILAAFLCLGLQAQVTLTRAGDRVDVTVDGKPFTAFYFGADTPKPYLHPLRSASGKILTRGFPMVKDVPGETHDHPHHRGLFFAHGDVNGVDFWGEGTGKGHIVLKNLGELKSGKEAGVLPAHMLWQDPSGKTLLEESRTMIFRKNIVDFEMTLYNHGKDKVVLGDTKEGTFAIRVARALEEKNHDEGKKSKCEVCTGVMVSSEGAHGEKEIWGKRADWVDYSGTVEGEQLGIAIFDHSKNPKHPAYWHARGYGLFAVNQFGEHDYYNDKARDGSLAIPPGGNVTFRYRVLIHSGDAAAGKVAEQYNHWAH